MQNLGVDVIPISTINIGQRQRKEVDEQHILKLRADIAENGLIHAPSITPEASLIAGWCRLKAITGIDQPYRYGSATIQPGFIPVVRVAEGDERILFRIELAENLRRKNLSPVDEAAAVAKLHEIFKAENPLQTPAETGKALDEVRGVEPRAESSRNREVAEALIIDSFKDDPDVAKAKTRPEALKIAKKKLEQQFTASLGSLAAINAGLSSDFVLHEGSCIDILPTLPADAFHGIVTDPPYGMGADSFGEQTNALGHQYDDDEKSALDIAYYIFEHGLKLCKSDAHLYMFCDIRLWPRLAATAKSIGWQPFATPLIWYKPGLGHAPQPGYFGRRYECILFAQKGNRKLTRSGSDVLVCPAVKDKLYAAQKPVELLQEILGLSFYPGESILDPCVGSGSLFRAGKLAKLRVTGIELNPTAIGLAKAAIAEAGKK
jgi:site-specific DNA-methyltransferase (adenine-specific)